MAEVDPEHRRAALPRHLRGPQDRAVAADDHRQLAVGGRRRCRRRTISIGGSYAVASSPRSSASSASSRTTMSCSVSALQKLSVTSRAALPAGVGQQQHAPSRRRPAHGGSWSRPQPLRPAPPRRRSAPHGVVDVVLA